MSPTGLVEEGAERGRLLLGNEAFGHAAVAAGVSAAYAYPGTLSNEIVVTIMAMAGENGRSVVAVIGDSTFFHSRLTAPLDAMEADTAMTLLIVEYKTTAMTGTQPTIAPPSHLRDALAAKGAALVETNLAAFRFGREVSACTTAR